MGMIQVLTDGEKNDIHRTVLRILEEIGVKIENERILSRLSDFGAVVDRKAEVARFPKSVIESYIASAEPWPAEPPAPIECTVGIYIGKYLDPATDRFEDWTEARMADFVKVAKALPNVSGIGTLGCPVPAPHRIHPLYVKYLCWKLDIGMDVSIQSLELCPYIEEFHSLRAETLGIPLKESMRGTMFLISPLKFARTDAEQFLYFADRGYGCSVSNMTTLGGSGPVTLAGGLALHLAEDIFCNIIQHLYYGAKRLFFLCSILPLDMRLGAYCYGRPENPLANLLHGQMARFYGGQHVGQTGLTDAKRPGAEAATQRLLTCLPELMYFGTTMVQAGLLSGDEIHSPVQMIIDNELVDALKRLARRETFDADHLAFDVLRAVGHGGGFMNTDHTSEHFREAQWIAPLWTYMGHCRWESEGQSSLEERATKRWREIMAGPDPAPGMDGATEAKVKALLKRAEKALGGK